MSKLNWEKSNTSSKSVKYNLDNPTYNPFKSNKIGNDIHITNLAKKCYDRMIKDAKNSEMNPEDIWVKSLTWAKKVTK